MSDPIIPALPSQQPIVGLTLDDAVSIAEALGSAASAFNPALAGTVTAVEGIVFLLRNALVPAIQKARSINLSIEAQAQLAADSALERAKAGAPPATIN